MKSILAAGAIALASTIPAAADLISVSSSKTMSETVDALASAVEGAGASIFARVDHAAGAASIDTQIGASQVLIFGNPKVGTPAIESDPRAGLFLPLKVLTYEDADGNVFLTYEDPADMFEGLEIAPDAPYIAMMQGALGKLTAAAAE